MTEHEQLIDDAFETVAYMVSIHGMKVLPAITGAVAALSVANGRADFLREHLVMLNTTIDQMVAKRRSAAQ